MNKSFNELKTMPEAIKTEPETGEYQNHFDRIKDIVDGIAVKAHVNSSKHILIHDKMLDQLQNDQDYYKSVFRELQQLAYANSCDSISEYLTNQHVKKMAGSGSYIWKYRISKGDRLLYTFGKYIKGIRSEYFDSLVLIGYSKHDKQGRDARAFGFNETKENLLADFLVASQQIDSKDSADACFESEDFDNELLFFLDKHKLFCVDETRLAAADFYYSDAYLSSEQAECVESFIYSPSPSLILGGAGTGKTLIALHVINDFLIVNETQRAVYFTQSYELRKSAQKRFEVFANSSTNVDFEDVNEFAFGLLNRPLSDMAKLVTQAKFVKEFPLWLSKNARGSFAKKLPAIDWISVWTEIRGIIKGMLGADWNRFVPIFRSTLGDKIAVDYLLENCWLKELSSDKRYLVPYCSISDLKKRLNQIDSINSYDSDDSDDIDDDVYKALLRELLSYFSDVDLNCRDMGKDMYLSLSEEDSTISSEKRLLYWDIYQYYDLWLKEEELIDENDLARMALQSLSKDRQSARYDLLCIDEIQDYTEMQILLLNRLCRNNQNILYAGDGNQNVNPTLFRVDHLSRLYSFDSKPLKICILHRDFRCPGNVVKLSNRLAEIRAKKIAKQHFEQEVVLESVLEEGSVPYRLSLSDENLAAVLSEMAKYPSSIFLVPDEETKNNINEFAILSGIEDLPLIHTVPEIKGMEYKYVLCYDIIGKYYENWSSIMSENHVRKQTGERYFFNLLYVGLTRSMMYLGFIDRNTVPELESLMSLRLEKSFDPVQLHFTEMQNRPEDWFNTAIVYENVGNYEDAKRMYFKANADSYIIHRCNSQIARSEHRYDDSFRYALFAKNDDLLKDAAFHISDKSALFPFAMSIFNKESCRMKAYPLLDDISDYLKYYFSEFAEKEQSDVRKLMLDSFSESTNIQIAELKEFFNNDRK